MAHRPAQPADGAIPGYLKGKKTFGIVLNPEKWDIMCSFPRDGQTDHRRCSGPLEQDDNCVDGCSPTFDATWNPRLSFWCTSGFPNRTCGFDHCYQCAYPPDKIGVMMLELWSRASDPARGWKAWWCGDNWCGDRQHWPVMINEVVADRRTLVTALPESVDAMFYYSADECDASCRTLAQHEHAQFLAKFGLTAAAFPLLVVDVHNWNAPFGLAPSSSL